MTAPPWPPNRPRGSRTGTRTDTLWDGADPGYGETPEGVTRLRTILVAFKLALQPDLIDTLSEGRGGRRRLLHPAL